MKNQRHIRFYLLLFSLICSVFAAQNTAQSYADTDLEKWERLGFRGYAISNDGRWLVYPITRNNEENELRLHKLNEFAMSVSKILAYGGNQEFSSDSKWLAYSISPDPKTQKELRKKKKPVRKDFEILNLASGKTDRVKEIQSFAFSADGKFVVLKPYPEEKSKSESSNIIVRNLANRKDTIIGNVKEYEWSEDGAKLAVIVEAKNKVGNGVKIFDGRFTATLDSEKAIYSGLSWSETGDGLAVFRSHEEKGFKKPTNDVLVWENVAASTSNAFVFDPLTARGFPKNMRIVEDSPLMWSLDGKSVYFSVDKWKRAPEKPDPKAAKKEKKEQPEIPALEIWNSSDIRTIPEQKSSANDNSYLSVWHLDTDKFVRLGSDRAGIVGFQPDSKTLLAFDSTPYDFDGMFGRPSYDVYSLDVRTGSRKKLLTDNIYSQDVSPDGRFFVYVKDDHYHLFDLTTGKDKNITGDLDASFVNLDDDHPVEQTRPYGFAGWDKTGSYFVVHSKYDIWKFDAKTGRGTRLTNGKTGQISHRYSPTDRPELHVDFSKPVYVRRFGLWSKRSGYSRLSPDNTLKHLSWGDNYAARLTVAKDKDITAFSIERFDASPNFFVSENGSPNLKQVTNTNPDANKYKAGKTELIEYTNANGKKLQGILYYPNNYVAGRKYPMITYIYERLSNGLHVYEVPSRTSYYNTKIFTNSGFFVLKPDIIFDTGDPGVSSVKTMEIAVKTVVDRGLVDEKMVGLVGHSWGGYQTLFAVTQTN
ncbi:MAG: hypothetical protein HKN33_05675, partial [Pyrinomonadaceae bacterium]|nr:hypothetical protein [Pyrinomonadaceae bacterium]